MKLNFFKTLLLFGIILCCFGLGFAQTEIEKNPDPTKKMDLPEGLQETIQKRRIKAEEKEFQELIQSGEEAVKISDELAKSYEETKKLTTDDQKKLEKLEKIVKKIRNELGAEDDKEKTAEDTPSSLSVALNNIKDNTASLLGELKKRTKYSISVIAVESSNTIWKLVKFLRINRN